MHADLNQAQPEQDTSASYLVYILMAEILTQAQPEKHSTDSWIHA